MKSVTSWTIIIVVASFLNSAWTDIMVMEYVIIFVMWITYYIIF